MKILQVICGLGKAAGTSVFCAELSNELVAAGHEVTIAICDPSATDIFPLDPRIRRVAISSLFKHSNIQAFQHFALVHIHALWSPVLHKVAQWARCNSIPIVWSPHGMLTPWAMNNKWVKKFVGWHLYQKRDLQSAALLHATAQSEVDDIRRMGLKNKVVIAPLGVRLPHSNNQANKKQSNKSKTLLFVSRVQRKKGLPNLIEAWSRLPETLRKEWQVRIVGPDQDGHVSELKAQCDHLGIGWHDCLSQSSNRTIERSSIFFVGPKYDAGLSAEYDNADLFVLPTHSENFGSVVIEALAHGLPVICTRKAPWRALVEYRCGWWIDDDVDSLTTELRMVIEQTCAPNKRKMLREMGCRGRDLVRFCYTWMAVCDKMLHGYREVVDARS